MYFITLYPVAYDSITGRFFLKKKKVNKFTKTKYKYISNIKYKVLCNV